MPLEYFPQAHYLVSAPGRVNLLGEHIDYNDGAVLPVAIDRRVQLAALPRTDRTLHLHSIDFDQRVIIDLERLEEKVDAQGEALSPWALYPAGVAWALEKHGCRVSGISAAYTSDIPIGAGLSSSAAVEVAFATLWQELGGWHMDRLTLAQRCQEAENRYVGVNCGLMDQFASACGVAEHALYFDTRYLTFQALPLPPRVVIVIADSGVRRTLSNSAYNERRETCEEALHLLRRYLPGIRALRDVSPAAFDLHAHHLPPVTRRRARHVVEECARVEAAVRCLAAGDAAGFGKLMFECHTSLRDLYQVSCAELDCLVEIAGNLPGCLGSRLTGAGFGGCTVSLVAADRAASFIESLKEGYQRSMGREARVVLCRPSDGVRVEKLK